MSAGAGKVNQALCPFWFGPPKVQDWSGFDATAVAAEASNPAVKGTVEMTVAALQSSAAGGKPLMTTLIRPSVAPAVTTSETDWVGSSGGLVPASLAPL